MNVTITGYVTFACSHCGKSHTFESQALTFDEDTSEEAAEDEYLRYLAQIDTACVACSHNILIKFDVWEHPESVVNYSYYGVQGAQDIECEFNIEHYFDDEEVGDHQYPADEDEPNKNEDETDFDEEEKAFNETLENDVYVDRYDDED